jgi:hypothetical protein
MPGGVLAQFSALHAFPFIALGALVTGSHFPIPGLLVCSAGLCGTDFMLGHALVDIPEDLPPLEVLARVALADPMIGPTPDRARLIGAEMQRLGSEALVISRIPGASRCAREGNIIRQFVQENFGMPTLEIEVPPLSDSLAAALNSGAVDQGVGQRRLARELVDRLSNMSGTGRFLEVVATRLGVPLGELGALVLQSRCPASISSMCAVFAETEIVGLLAGGRHPADIVAGVQAAISRRVGRWREEIWCPPSALRGRVALVPGMAQSLEKALGHPVGLAPQPLLTGALGAALLALKM